MTTRVKPWTDGFWTTWTNAMIIDPVLGDWESFCTDDMIDSLDSAEHRADCSVDVVKVLPGKNAPEIWFCSFWNTYSGRANRAIVVKFGDKAFPELTNGQQLLLDRVKEKYDTFDLLHHAPPTGGRWTEKEIL